MKESERSVFSAFSGTLEKIVIESERCGFLQLYESMPEIRQRVTMRRNGSVTFTRYFVKSGELLRKTKHYRHKPTEKIMDYIAWYFEKNELIKLESDVGYWNAKLTNSDGKVFEYHGSMCEDIEVTGYKLSTITRRVLEISDLWLFDGGVKAD